MNLILCGFKKCGKSYYGAQLAARLNVAFIDTDKLIEAQPGGMGCAEIMRSKGEAHFRALEKEAVRSLLDVRGSVIALGGGTLLDPENAQLLSGLGQIVYLFVKREELKRRILESPLSSLFTDESRIEQMIAEREPIYERYCHIKITEEEVLEWVATALV